MSKWQELSNGDHFISLSPILYIRIRKSSKYTIEVNDLFLGIEDNINGFEDAEIAKNMALKCANELLNDAKSNLELVLK